MLPNFKLKIGDFGAFYPIAQPQEQYRARWIPCVAVPLKLFRMELPLIQYQPESRKVSQGHSNITCIMDEYETLSHGTVSNFNYQLHTFCFKKVCGILTLSEG